MFEDPRMMRDFLKLGVSGYLLKSSSTSHLIGAVRAATLDPEEGNVVVGMPREMLENAGEGTGGILSARQLEILLLTARGLSNRQIASRLHIAEGTVKRHLANTYKKMEVGSRSEAMRKALQEDWITIGGISEEEEHEGKEAQRRDGTPRPSQPSAARSGIKTPSLPASASPSGPRYRADPPSRCP